MLKPNSFHEAETNKIRSIKKILSLITISFQKNDKINVQTEYVTEKNRVKKIKQNKNEAESLLGLFSVIVACWHCLCAQFFFHSYAMHFFYFDRKKKLEKNENNEYRKKVEYKWVCGK